VAGTAFLKPPAVKQRAELDARQPAGRGDRDEREPLRGRQRPPDHRHR
jgi:hypothetical protein